MYLIVYIFHANYIIFTKVQYQFVAQTRFHYQLILRHVQLHLLASKSGQNMLEN